MKTAMRQQAEEQKTFTHVGGASQHLVAANQLLPGGSVTAVPQEDLQGAEEIIKRGHQRRSRVRSRLNAPAHLHPGINAHVLEKRLLGDWSHAGHACSGRLPQVTEVHVSGEVS